MKRFYTLFMCMACTLLLAAQTTKTSYTGNSTTHIMGKTEVKQNLVLQVRGEGCEKAVQLSNYGVLGYKNISITGKVTLDKQGKIISTRDIDIKGAPAKVKSVVGTITEGGANITLEGKAAGMFSFDVHYLAK